MEKINMTQAELDAMITEAKKGLFDEGELTKRVTSEVDRRVETGIQKGLETQKKKWEQDFSERMKLSAEELAHKELEEKMNGLSQKEKAIMKRSNELEAKSRLAEASIPKSHYEKFIPVLVSDDEAITQQNVDNFIAMFNETKLDIEAKIKSESTKMTPPEQGKANVGTSKQDFDKMGYAEKLKFKQSNTELYTKFMK